MPGDLAETDCRPSGTHDAGTHGAGTHDAGTCATISSLLGRVGDKWTVLVIRTLGAGPIRFNALRREVGDISQKMLASTLRNLERDGFVRRTVTPATPPQVEYDLTELGRSLAVPVCALARWTAENAGRIEAARRDYAARAAAAGALHAPGERGFSGP